MAPKRVPWFHVLCLPSGHRGEDAARPPAPSGVTIGRPTGLPQGRQRGSLRHLPGKRARPSPPGRLSLPPGWLPTWINLAEYVGARRSYGYGDALESSRRVCLDREVGCRRWESIVLRAGRVRRGRAPPFAEAESAQQKPPALAARQTQVLWSVPHTGLPHPRRRCQWPCPCMG